MCGVGGMVQRLRWCLLRAVGPRVVTDKRRMAAVNPCSIVRSSQLTIPTLLNEFPALFPLMSSDHHIIYTSNDHQCTQRL
jgi:hypothetical protein